MPYYLQSNQKIRRSNKFWALSLGSLSHWGHWSGIPYNTVLYIAELFKSFLSQYPYVIYSSWPWKTCSFVFPSHSIMTSFWFTMILLIGIKMTQPSVNLWLDFLTCVKQPNSPYLSFWILQLRHWSWEHGELNPAGTCRHLVKTSNLEKWGHPF